MQSTSLLSQMQTPIPNSLFSVLEDIVHSVHISDLFCISHPNYKPLEVPGELVQKFLKLPSIIREQYKIAQLQSFLYGVYYNGSLREALALNSQTDNSTLYRDLENNMFLGVDLGFYDRLHASNQGQGYFDSGWRVVREESDGSVVVDKQGLALHIERSLHLKADQQTPNVGDLISIKLPRNLVQNGFYVAMSNCGAESTNSVVGKASDLVRVYFNLDPEGAIAVMEHLTGALNSLEMVFSLKMLYNPRDYGRFDSGVLYFEKSNYAAVHFALQPIYNKYQQHFRPETPLFTKLLAPGLALAEEPIHKFAVQESFGQNRCRIVANGLLKALEQGDSSPEARLSAIVEQFSLLKIDLQAPYLNPGSEDTYIELT